MGIRLRRARRNQALPGQAPSRRRKTTEKKMHNLSNAHQSGPEATREEFPAPIGRLLGLIVLEQGNGHAVIEFRADERYANPMGTLHGGVLCDIADAAMGV